LKEDAALQGALDKIGWEAVKPREIYFLNSMNRARKASESKDALAAYITDRSKVVSGVWSKTETTCLLASVLASDGVTADESAFLAQVKAAMA
jgi:UDP-N-acetylmuramate-alanine ligase